MTDPWIDIEAILRFARQSGVWDFMHTTWGWPIIEVCHYVGLSLLFGTVGLYDLRVIGLAKSMPLAPLHRLIPLGVLGLVINLVTGTMFFVNQPELYVYNPAFQVKVAAMAIAFANIIVFYAFLARRTNHLGPGDDASGPAKIAAAVSFLAWTTVLAGGRFIGFFKPPEFWCLWCVPA